MADSAEKEVDQARLGRLGTSHEGLHEGHLRRLQQAQRPRRVLHVVRLVQANVERARNLQLGVDETTGSGAQRVATRGPHPGRTCGKHVPV